MVKNHNYLVQIKTGEVTVRNESIIARSEAEAKVKANGIVHKIVDQGYCFKYGQWIVTMEKKNNNSVFEDKEDPYVSIDVCGDWRATQGMLCNANEKVAYDEPELLPKGLKVLIDKRAKEIIVSN